MEDKAKCGHSLYWHNCYKGSQDLYHSDAFQHPAKMAIPLAFRIMEHLKELGLLKEEDTILDPMSGISTTGIVASALGHKFIGVELEEKFIELSKKNKEYAERKLYTGFVWQLIKGDSRKLSSLLTGNALKSITSPPYGDQVIKDGQRLASNPDIHWREWDRGTKYNLDNPDNIGNLKDVPLKSITSPPYQDSQGHPSLGSVNKDDWGKEGKDIVKRRGLSGEYGETEGQVGNLKSVMSPPYEDAKGDKHHSPRADVLSEEKSLHETYTERGAENVGNEKGESYLEAMKRVYSEIALVSDCLTIVLKNPTRNGRIRRLDLGTLAILKECGWEIHCQHRALLFEELEQADMFEGSKKQVKGRLSFFKRLSWQNGNPVASWEDIIICTRKS